MSESKPELRLLVATEFPPNASGGGPAVVRQMLKDWPTENLFWWSCLPEKDQRFGHYVVSIPSRLSPNKRFARIRSKLIDPLGAHGRQKVEQAIRDEDLGWSAMQAIKL